jgi:hypothetical protein
MSLFLELLKGSARSILHWPRSLIIEENEAMTETITDIVCERYAGAARRVQAGEGSNAWCS